LIAPAINKPARLAWISDGTLRAIAEVRLAFGLLIYSWVPSRRICALEMSLASAQPCSCSPWAAGTLALRYLTR
jgi:hypothetical protein